ncbi:hypothetical protein BGX23_000947 [Mortierella sp. AD031]|nr:hypothetical protein BGX23_000947 [Mortierella sp. AD031]
MIEHCPELVTLEVLRLQPADNIEHTASYAFEHCPKLANLTIHQDEDCNTRTSLMVAIVQAMPQDTLVFLEVFTVDGNHPECLEARMKDVLLYRWVSKELRVANVQDLDDMTVTKPKTDYPAATITEEQKKVKTPSGRLYRKIQFLKKPKSLQLSLSVED